MISNDKVIPKFTSVLDSNLKPFKNNSIYSKDKRLNCSKWDILKIWKLKSNLDQLRKDTNAASILYIYRLLDSQRFITICFKVKKCE